MRTALMTMLSVLPQPPIRASALSSPAKSGAARTAALTRRELRPGVGAGEAATGGHIRPALALVARGLWFWLACAALAAALSHA